MSAIRDEIRQILREELAALRGGAGTVPGIASGAAAEPADVERVAIGSSAELDRFARELLARAASPTFVERVLSGRHRFALVGTGPAGAPPSPAALVTSGGASAAAGPRLDKALVTERDIAALDRGARALTVSRQARLTPLARDEARRRGIRIHRTET